MTRPRLTSAVMRGIGTYTMFTMDLNSDLEDRPKERQNIERADKYFQELMKWYSHHHPDFDIIEE